MTSYPFQPSLALTGGYTTNLERSLDPSQHLNLFHMPGLHGVAFA